MSTYIQIISIRYIFTHTLKTYIELNRYCSIWYANLRPIHCCSFTHELDIVAINDQYQTDTRNTVPFMMFFPLSKLKLFFILI